MTRINVVPVGELCDKHLLAEYRELPRVFRLARPCSDAPKEYMLGAGHVKFFYDKLTFLRERFYKLVAECDRRGFEVRYRDIPEDYTSAKCWNKYTPTPAALALNRARIAERIGQFKRTK